MEKMEIIARLLAWVSHVVDLKGLLARLWDVHREAGQSLEC